ncbi:hypothetical protein ACQ5SO_06795 [Rhodovulum sp. DZ06]
MVSKSVAPPGLIDQIAGDQFAWLIDSPIFELGLAAIIFATVASKIFSSS